MVRLHKDYSYKEFKYDRIEKAWTVINGTPISLGCYFFVAHLVNQPLGDGGNWMAFLRKPAKRKYLRHEDLVEGNFLISEADKFPEMYIDVPFGYEGFAEPGDADNAVHHRVYQELGWRIEEIEVNALPKEIDKNTKGLLSFVNH